MAKSKDRKPLVVPGPDADMAEKAEYAWEVIRREIEDEAEKSGKPLGFAEGMVLKGFGDMLPAIFTLKPNEAKMYGERIFALMSYVLGYSDSPGGE
ncbi:MAG: hypothetical protein AB1753_06925 [Thermoproteota archaeon]